jgi:hypothetical protein
LISVSLAPGSYFVCASADDTANSNAVAANAGTTRVLAFLTANARCDSAIMIRLPRRRFPHSLRFLTRRA